MNEGRAIPPIFAEKINEIHELLDSHSISYRLLGSVATFSHLNGRTDWHLNFDRSRFLPRHQRVPDLDILVRWSDLPIAKELRDRLLKDRRYPVNLELLSGMCHYDWRPDEDLSYLVHSGLRVPFASTLFDASDLEVEGATIKTIGPRSLLHTYVTMGATLREKDRGLVRALARIETGASCGSAFWPFHQFIRMREDAHRGYVLSRVILEKLRTTLPPAPFYWIVNAGKKFQLQPLLFGTKLDK